jgi:hypothetical protein
VGRDTGYDNNGESICYTNIESIRRYEVLWVNEFKNESIRTRVSTFNDLSHYGNDEDLEAEEKEEEISAKTPAKKNRGKREVKT